MKLLDSGAEAILSAEGNTVRKHRKAKAYRHPEIDRKLRYERMHREANLLGKLAKLGIAAPKLISRDEETATLTMERIKGELLRDVLEKGWKRFAKELGQQIAALHAADIVHGDLTTSNMIVRKTADIRRKKQSMGNSASALRASGGPAWEIVFIDFGLSFISRKVEDKAVDLHLLRQALDSKHHTVAEQCYPEILAAYRKHYRDAKAVLQRLEKVEQRGKYKGKAE